MTRADRLFSNQAQFYKSFRPTYPDDLYAYLRSLTGEGKTAWDVGCGSGQFTKGLVDHYDKILATDVSKEQLDKADPHPKIEYLHLRAERTPPLEPHSVDLITVAQALHWFDRELFYEQVFKLLKPNTGLFAAILYKAATFPDHPRLDSVFTKFHSGLLETSWSPGVLKAITSEYECFNFPFTPVTNEFSQDLTVTWDWAHFQGCLDSWSAVQIYKKSMGGQHPLEAKVEGMETYREMMARLWAEDGVGTGNRTIIMPLRMKLGRFEV